MNFSELPQRTDVQESDQVIGYREASAGGEGRWTFAAIKTWLATLFAPLTHSHAQSDVTGLASALSGKVSSTEKGAANGVASLDTDGKVPLAQLPSGLGGGGGGAVSSVAGKTGDVTLVKADVGLGSVDNTPDAAKPVSTAQAAAIAAKADVSALTAHTGRTDNPHSVTRAQIGLGNVDNTPDSAKPISVATQAALDAKAPLASPALTGVPTAPTAVADTNTTQLATTAFAKKEADDAQAAAVQRANHTGTQTASTISDFAAAAAAASPVQSVAGRTGNVTLTGADVGLGGVDNTPDSAKPVSTAQAAALALKISSTEKGAANGVAPLGSDSKIPATYLPDTIDGTILVRSGLDTDVGVAVLARDSLLSARELAWDETRKGFRVGDGSTAGGELVNGLPVPRTLNTTAWDANKTANSGASPRVVAEMDATLGIPLVKFPQAAGGSLGGLGVDNGALRVVTGLSGKDFFLTKTTVDMVTQSVPRVDFFVQASGDMIPLQFLLTTEREVSIYLTHTATLGSLTIMLPTNAVPGFNLRLFFLNPVTSLTVSMTGSATLLTGSAALPTSATAGMELLLVTNNYSTSNLTTATAVDKWLRVR